MLTETVSVKPNRFDRTVLRAKSVFDEARTAGRLTLEALIPARAVLSKSRLNRAALDIAIDAIHDYADEFFDQDYPEGTFGYSSQLPNG